MTAREVLKKLKDAGWVELRHSKHLILTKDGKICPIPMHGSADIKIGTLISIERITGVKLR
jgi:predicted RNA binding protein YcfA (HicA-like mRNA interferase family)